MIDAVPEDPLFPVAPSYAAFLKGLAAARDAYEAACTEAQRAYLGKLESLRITYEADRAAEQAKETP
jgi:hypothetical protein